jgi:hypothetical protein
MSNGTTPERPTPHQEAWSLEDRKQMMRDVVRLLAQKNALKLENAAAFATTYGVPEPCVTAEMMKHLSEGDGK